MEERRKYIRINESLAVHYQILKAFMKSGSRSKDISGGGICFPVLQNIPVGTILELEIESPQIVRSIKATGMVKWIKKRENLQFPYEIGVEFINIDSTDRNNLINYIKERAKDKESPDIDWLG